MSRQRSWLFVPGDRPERFPKAVRSDAHAVVCDLEDGVLPAHKPEARAHIRAWTESGGTAFVRVNSIDSEWFDDDIDALRDAQGVQGFLIPKCETRKTVEMMRRRIDENQAVIVLIETASGLSRVAEIAEADGLSRLGFGSFDYAADLNMAHTATALLHARSTLVMASGAAGIEAPLDGVTADFQDIERTREEAKLSRELGFGGKMCIHPSQVVVINESFAPTPTEIEWARRILDSASKAGRGVFAVDGELIDGPQIQRAHAILAGR